MTRCRYYITLNEGWPEKGKRLTAMNDPMPGSHNPHCAHMTTCGCMCTIRGSSDNDFWNIFGFWYCLRGHESDCTVSALCWMLSVTTHPRVECVTFTLISCVLRLGLRTSSEEAH